MTDGTRNMLAETVGTLEFENERLRAELSTLRSEREERYTLFDVAALVAAEGMARGDRYDGFHFGFVASWLRTRASIPTEKEGDER